ncbi:hypothetical protein CBR_g23482 [Chara braunii]|uniref:Uncharacterized protein n=1 Tax=Chara braunii TaxID=69332 RepID=A0A388L4B8_CHABU|nr:hypothetical protein CBR_g23482 [Chara braunii]|eukprot:GBG77155.1 hypothetical protein CBR_g23482 [Chara braunii]
MAVARLAGSDVIGRRALDLRATGIADLGRAEDVPSRPRQSGQERCIVSRSVPSALVPDCPTWREKPVDGKVDRVSRIFFLRNGAEEREPASASLSSSYRSSSSSSSSSRRSLSLQQPVSCPSFAGEQLPVGATAAICQRTGGACHSSLIEQKFHPQTSRRPWQGQALSSGSTRSCLDRLEVNENTLRRDEKSSSSSMEGCVLPPHGPAADDLLVPIKAKREEQATMSFDRRSLMAMVVSGGLGVLLDTSLDTMTGGTALATPLETPSGNGKRKHLPLEEIKSIIECDIKEGKYLLTGDLTKEVYTDDCRFEDPTNVTIGVDRYVQTVKTLFDPDSSIFEFRSIAVSGENTIDAAWVLGGVLKFPWRPHISPVNGVTRYTINDDGLVAIHSEVWDVSPLKALLESFTPYFGK